MVYPVLEFDYLRNPDLADNIWHAQKMGHPKILTYGGPVIKPANRDGAMHYEVNGAIGTIPQILTRDEYPFACTLEGGPRAWVGHIPGGQNSSQGGLIAAFISKNGILPTTAKAPQKEQYKARFEVRVVNHPGGPV